jgi:Ca2+-binding RTX toxin-like protein
LDDEETINITTDSATDDLTITAFDAADLTTLNLSGAGDIIITAFTAVTDMPTTVNATGMTGASTVSLANAVAAVTMTGGSGVDTFTGGLLADTINGGAGADVLVGGNGADTIDGGTGADTVTGGAGADTMTGGAGQDTFAAAWGTGLASTTSNFAGAAVAVGDTITFGNGVDIVTDFTAGTGGDIVNTAGAAAEATLIGATVADLGDDHVYWASGSWDAASKTFIFLADGTGSDTMVIDSVNATNDAADVLTTNSSIIILLGVDTDDLVAANIA